MKTPTSLAFTVGTFIVGALIVACSKHPPVKQPTQAPNAGYQLLFSIPIGDKGIHYEGTSEEEVEDVGPSSLSIDKNGNFIISDSVGSRILQFSKTGEQLRTIPVKDISTITDVMPNDDNLI